MSRFRELDEFNRRFPGEMDLVELEKWRAYWIEHARHLAPKVQKLAMKRVHEIDREIARRQSS